MMKKNRTNRLDEMQNQKLMKLEEYGFWIMFWTLLASIVVQLILGCSLKEVLGEIVVFLIGSVYLTATTLKNGLWERTSTPSRKGNAAVSAVPAILIGIINVLKIIQNDKADTKSILITTMSRKVIRRLFQRMNSIWFKRRSNGAPSRGVGTVATASFHRSCSAGTVAGFTVRRSGIPMICIAS